MTDKAKEAAWRAALDAGGVVPGSTQNPPLLTKERIDAALAAYDRERFGEDVVVPMKLQEKHLAAGVMALINAGLDGPDGVGHSDVQAVWDAVLAAQSREEQATPPDDV